MLKATHTKYAPWTLVDFNDQKLGRLTLLRHLLDHMPYKKQPLPKLKLPAAARQAQARAVRDR